MLTWNATGKKNRAHNCLTVSNLKLDSVCSNVFGKSTSAIMDFMLEHPGRKFDVAPFVHSRCKPPLDEIKAADGPFSTWQAEKLKSIKEHMKEIEHCKRLLENLIFQLAEPISGRLISS